MNTRTNRFLESMEKKLRRQENTRSPARVRSFVESRRAPAKRKHVREEEAFGPTFSQDQVGSDKSHLSSKAGVGGATNVPDGQDAFDKYMTTCMDALMNGLGWEEGRANSFINRVAGELERENMLPAMPSEGSENEMAELAIWMAAAHSVGFIAELLQRARASE